MIFIVVDQFVVLTLYNNTLLGYKESNGMGPGHEW